QLLAEELARDFEHVRHQWACKFIVRESAFPPDSYDPASPEDREVLGDDRLFQVQQALELTDRPLPRDPAYQNADAGWVGEDAKKLTLQQLEWCMDIAMLICVGQEVTWGYPSIRDW